MVQFAQAVNNREPAALARTVLSEALSFGEKPLHLVRDKVKESLLNAVRVSGLGKEEQAELSGMLESFQEPAVVEATMIVQLEAELKKRAQGTENDRQLSPSGVEGLRRLPQGLIASLPRVDTRHPDITMICEEGGFSQKEATYVASWYRSMGDKPEQAVIRPMIEQTFPSEEDVSVQKRAIISRLLLVLESYPDSVRTAEDYGFPAEEVLSGEGRLLHAQLSRYLKEDAELEPRETRSATDDFRHRLTKDLQEKILPAFLCLKQEENQSQQVLCGRQFAYMFAGYAAELSKSLIDEQAGTSGVPIAEAIHAQAVKESADLTTRLEQTYLENMDLPTAHRVLSGLSRELLQAVESYMKYDAISTAVLKARIATAKQAPPPNLEDFFISSGESLSQEHHSIQDLDALRLAQKAAIERQQKALWS
jgi:hypothetical protein